jgi:hypothetical protein
MPVGPDTAYRNAPPGRRFHRGENDTCVTEIPLVPYCSQLDVDISNPETATVASIVSQYVV